MRPLLLLASLFAAQIVNQDPAGTQRPDTVREGERRLPNGKLQSTEILKADYEKSLKDAEQLVELSRSLEVDLKKETSQVLSLGDLKKLDEIEKITKRIRGRIRRF